MERRRNSTQAAAWFNKAADQGNPGSLDALGVMYRDGIGVRQDFALALRMFRTAADQGLAAAQANLGWMYYYGRGALQDYAQAVAWFRKAADQGEARGQSGLGLMYGTGLGVPQDFVLAYMWFNLAAYRAEGSPREESAGIRDMAVKSRDMTAAQMTPDQIAEAQKMAREWKPTKAAPPQ